MQDLDHKHLIVTAALKSPPRTAAQVEDWLRRMVEAVDMAILFGPHVTRCDTPGNEGVTGIVCIETSHASIHVWDTLDVPFLKFDLYSCKRFDPTILTDMLSEFEPYYFRTMLLDRNETIKVVAKEDVQVLKVIDLLDEHEREAYLEAHRISKSERTDHHRQARSKYNSLASKFSVKAIDRERKYVVEHRTTIASIKARCLKKNLDFDLTPEWYAEAVSTAQLRWPKIVVHQSEDAFWRAEVDRIDPTKGYTQENCRIIPGALNKAKWNWTKRELCILAELLNEEAR